MDVLVTGGAGFIGRWVVKRLLYLGHRVTVLDNLSNSTKANLEEFSGNTNFIGLLEGDVKDNSLLKTVFARKFGVCFHLAASINVQNSIDDPGETFANDVVGTFNILEECRRNKTKLVFMSTCMVYSHAEDTGGITETHPLKPASPYAGSKIAGESLALSYYYAYGLPVVVLRPFNTFGPFQKTNGEGGVVSIFIQNKINSQCLNIYGDGTQTRDLLYVTDCAEFVVSAGLCQSADGEIINAGSGVDTSINDLAAKICGNTGEIKHVAHIHPQSEIKRLLCNCEKAGHVLGFKPSVSLEEGLRLTEKWIREKQGKRG